MGRPDDPLGTYLLRVLVTLLSERNLTRVATRLNQTQPAISAALRKLRLIFRDELLVRSGGAMVPTPRALELLESGRAALHEIDGMLTAGEKFDPQTTQYLFKIGSPDYLSAVFLAAVTKKLRNSAPNSRLQVHPLGPKYDFEQALANGDLDVVIGNWPDPPEYLHMAPLMDDEIVCLMDRNHTLAHGTMTRKQYLRAPHIVPLPYSSMHRGVIDKHLASLRVTRNARVIVPFFSAAPNLLPGTDLIFTISRHFADHYARLLPLTVVPCPIDFPRMRFYQIWHSRNHQSSAQQWIRGILKGVAEAMFVDVKHAETASE